jgi:predicted nucleic acid-binding protein
VILVDTSAWYALLDEDDVNHGHAVDRWHTILDEHALLTHTYVVLETSALVQRRLGMAAVDQLHDGLLPVALLATIDRATHRRAVSGWRRAGNRRLSLVDVTSFTIMRDEGITMALAFDDDFVGAGFTLYG